MKLNWLDEIAKTAAMEVLVLELVPNDLRDFRRSVCETCPNLLNPGDLKTWRCGACGCWLEEKTKALRNRSLQRPKGEVTHCPNGFWNDKDIANHYRALDGAPLLT